ncbi:uncharacterized protein K441DRAFT_680899 [Cenococcum geophilum 1.58]|uniref:uncharacterized protein n=1 Tax=Cenococcum geophilum 1.58 TaxID=794803 RepID=UPI00358F54D7|nr:hypothetical protein K441DRAFT_680899 [Cenococcum geophilum 1.58]
MLYPGRILGVGRQDDDDTLPFLSLGVEFDGVEVSSVTQVDIWEAARVRAHEYGFTLPPEDETTHVPPALKTKIDRRLVNPEALEEAKERLEERPDCVIVLRVLSKEEIQKLADRTEEIRIARKAANTGAKQDQHAS